MSVASPQSQSAICLLSGGLDSATVMYMALRDGYQVKALTVCYGQRHGREVDCARQLAAAFNLDHQVLTLELPWKASALLDDRMTIPIHRDLHAMSSEIPSTYVPGRNSIFLALAVSYAEAVGAQTILIGANAIDYSGYPDCRPEYLNSLSKALAAGTKAGVEGRAIEIKAPLIDLSKKEIIIAAQSLGVPFEKTWSCYRGLDAPCGVCDSCLLRLKGFEEAGLTDPLMSYAATIRRR